MVRLSDDLRLFRYDEIPLTEVRDCALVDGLRFGDKPHGLWLSVGEAWPLYYRTRLGEQGWQADKLRWRTVVVLSPCASLTLLANVSDIDQFTHQFGVPRSERECRRAHPDYQTGLDVDWKQVRDVYDGIILTPFNRAEHVFEGIPWYYSWDCASACIWRARAVLKTGSPMRA